MIQQLRRLLTKKLHRAKHVGMRSFFAAQSHLNIVQVGANDGILDDTLRGFIETFKERIRAILIEPVPYVFSRLRENYSAYGNIKALQVAITPHAHERSREIYFLEDRNNSVYSLWSSFNKEHLENFRAGVKDFDSILKVEMVNCMTLNELFKANDLEEIQFLQIDVEGLDVSLVNSIDFDKYLPELIVFEHFHADGAELAALLIKLEKLHYTCFAVGADTVCVQQNQARFFWQLHWIKRIRPQWVVAPKAWRIGGIAD